MSDEIIAKPQSGKEALAILDEIAVKGNFRAVGRRNGFVVYGKTESGYHEKLWIEVPTKRRYEVHKSRERTGTQTTGITNEE